MGGRSQGLGGTHGGSRKVGVAGVYPSSPQAETAGIG